MVHDPTFGRYRFYGFHGFFEEWLIQLLFIVQKDLGKGYRAWLKRLCWAGTAESASIAPGMSFFLVRQRASPKQAVV